MHMSVVRFLNIWIFIVVVSPASQELLTINDRRNPAGCSQPAWSIENEEVVTEKAPEDSSSLRCSSCGGWS